MFKFKKSLFLLSSIISFGIFGLSQVSHADEISKPVLDIQNSIDSSQLETFDEYSVVDSNGDEIIFDNEEDYKFYLDYECNSNKERGYSNGTSWKTQVTSSSRKNNIWVGYHSGTPNWSKASSYTLTKNKTYSVSGSYVYGGGKVNTGFSYSKSVSTKIPANAKKYSRLGVRGDFTFRTIKTVEYKKGKKTGNVKTRKDKIRHNFYIAPKYK